MPGGDDRVCILMALYNGGAALAEQLESFTAQTHSAWDLLVSDDGSSDGSARVVEAFADRMRPAGHRVTANRPQIPHPDSEETSVHERPRPQ